MAEAYEEALECDADAKPTVALCVEASEHVVIKRWAPYDRVRVSKGKEKGMALCFRATTSLSHHTLPPPLLLYSQRHAVFMFGLDPHDAAAVLHLLADLRPLACDAATGGAAARARANASRAALVAAAQDATAFTPADLPPGAYPPVLDVAVSRLSPLCREPGRCAVAARRVVFRGAGAARAAAVVPLDAVGSVLLRRWRLDDVGLELFVKEADADATPPTSPRAVGRRGTRSSAALPPLDTFLPRRPPTSLYLLFRCRADRDRAAAAIAAGGGPKPTKPAAVAAAAAAAWTAGATSNYDHLLTLNLLAGRSFHDVERYPVFPWVVSDYLSRRLNLDNPSSRRDLAKPVGALTPARLAAFKARYADVEALLASERVGSGLAPPQRRRGCGCCGGGGRPPPPPRTPASLLLGAAPFLYGCHFSTPGYVAHWLLRPTPQLALRLQGGRYDEPDRLFNSLAGAWRSATTAPADVKELTPEFYMGDASLFEAPTGACFGATSDGRRVGDVALPPWARGDARAAATTLAAALEHPAVSAALPAWIDLVFGVNARGAAAQAADNVFYPLTYDGQAEEALRAAVADAGANPAAAAAAREAVLAQVAEFGRAPDVLFERAHPRRKQQRGAAVVEEKEVEAPADAAPPPLPEPLSPLAPPSEGGVTVSGKPVASFAVDVPVEWWSDEEEEEAH